MPDSYRDRGFSGAFDHREPGAPRPESSADELPLDEWRRAFASVRPPEPAEDLAEADAATREVVDWMRAAWRTVEPAGPVRTSGRRRGRLLRFPSRPTLVRAALGVAAALCLAASLELARRASHGRDLPARTYPGRTDPVRTEAPWTARLPEPREENTGDKTRENTGEGVPRIASLDRDRIEMRSGPVRLILLTGDTDPEETDGRTQGDES